MRSFILFFWLFSLSSAFAEDIIVERMQSVVDEVTQLRKQFEISQEQYALCQEKLALKCPSIEQSDHVDELATLKKENADLRKAHASFKQRLQNLEKLESEMEVLQKENVRLNGSAKILIDKNHTLLTQINTIKREQSRDNEGAVDTEELQALKREVATLKQTLKARQSALDELQQENKNLKKAKSAVVTNTSTDKALLQCKDELKSVKVVHQKNAASTKCPACPPCVQKNTNVFPKLVPKNAPLIKPNANKSVKVSVITEKEKVVPTIHEKGSAYRLKVESPIYNDPYGGIIEVWEEKTSFTSNVTWKEWVKITGYFVDKKWQKADRPLWIKLSHTIKR